MNRCKICGKTNDLFSFEFEADETDACEKWTSRLCGTCWEHIAAVARRTVKTQMAELTKRLEQLEAKLAERVILG